MRAARNRLKCLMAEPSARIDEAIQEIDQLIGSFKLRAATNKLTAFDFAKVPVARRAQFAQLCRRVGLDQLSLKLFHPWIHAPGMIKSADRLEYATCLRKVGLTREALRILSTLEASATVHLHQAYCHIQAWDYAEASRFLRLAQKQNPAEATTRLIQINLAAALVFLDQLDDAAETVDTIEPELKHSSRHLWIMSRLLRAQIEFRRGRFQDAAQRLQELSESTGDETGAPKQLIEKWVVLSRLADDPGPENQKALTDLRAALRKNKQWETLRGLDLEAALTLKQADQVTRIYFGTPYPALREKILRGPMGASIPRFYEWRDGRKKSGSELKINGLTGENMPFKFGSLQYRTILTLIGDAYQPWTYYRIFDAVFPDQAFDVHTSPKRVHQLVGRIRKEFESNELPLEVKATVNGYRIRVSAGACFLLAREMRYNSVQEIILELLRGQYQRKIFGTEDVTALAPINHVQAQRILKSLASDGEIVPVSESKRHRAYRLR